LNKQKSTPTYLAQALITLDYLKLLRRRRPREDYLRVFEQEIIEFVLQQVPQDTSVKHHSSWGINSRCEFSDRIHRRELVDGRVGDDSDFEGDRLSRDLDTH
jgi:hypothetical protein